ncbi:MAG TPA: PIN domain-containing protein [Bryobacteraceae bacterium]|jgi:predicted nucleic acid-binding protein|nr:PIN domain-containing protein [Bryobacteraceae bacterium]
MAQRTERGPRRLKGSSEAYVDTSALIAFLDRSDSHHPLFRRLFAAPPALIASALVIAEGHGWFLKRYDEHRAIQFLNFVAELRILRVESFDASALKSSTRVVQRFADQRLTLADAHGLVIMLERRVETCWSTDRHLGLTGVELVISR